MNPYSTFPVHVERLNDGKPILERIPAHPWENRVTFNPACVLLEDRAELDGIIKGLPFDDKTKSRLRTEPALCFLFYRAQGARTPDYDHSRSALGLAVLTAELRLLARYDKPLILPDQDYEDLGVEDPRISKFAGRYYMFYCAYSSALPANKVRIALASSDDLVHWEKHGLLKGAFNEINNKNAMFLGMIEGKLAILHRPMEGKDALTIHWATCESPLGEWKSRGAIIQPLPDPRFEATWIGGGIPPLKLGDGRYLVVYHIGNRTAGDGREYHLGIALADFAAEKIIVKRDEPFMNPETDAEIVADKDLGVGHVLFVCGGYFYKGDLIFPYAGADTCVLGAKVASKEIQRYISAAR
jgi:predicted GH43/DUF377 family glycosyl hydrolase